MFSSGAGMMSAENNVYYSTPCEQKNCKACSTMVRTSEFKDKDGKPQHVHDDINCADKEVIYGVYCDVDDKFIHVGETGRTLREVIEERKWSADCVCVEAHFGSPMPEPNSGQVEAHSVIPKPEPNSDHVEAHSGIPKMESNSNHANHMIVIGIAKWKEGKMLEQRAYWKKLLVYETCNERKTRVAGAKKEDDPNQMKITHFFQKTLNLGADSSETATDIVPLTE